MVRMVDDLLDVSRITYGKIHLRIETVDLVAVLERAITASAAERDEKQQTLESSLGAGPIYVNGDPMRLEQVFVNLLGNASKFTRHGGRIWLAAEKEASASGAAASAAVRVRDNGVGIDQAMLPQIFELFVQADRLSERARTGIGIGLTLAKRLLDLHGGTIEAHSAGNALGSEFIIRLPLAESGARLSAPKEPKKVAIARRRVLIVDDDRDSGESLRLLFSVAGHDTRLVGEGAQTVSAAAAFKPDVILLDIALPDMDGYRVARDLRADFRTRDALIVAVTGYGRDADRAKSRDAGIDVHMTKPIDPDTLLEHVAKGRSNDAG